ncbi:MAG: histidine phosphatase family protein [Chitinophagaceae bacterium]|nr:histidine phosphatase family protein [Chitinophagaceae bacterium]
MKRLILVRHAETEWHAPSGKDIDRLLTPKGLADAHNVATGLRLQNIIPDHIYSSSAKRAVQTAEVFRDVLSLTPSQLSTRDILYNPTLISFFSVIEYIPDDVETAMIFSHNPGITEFCNEQDVCPQVRLSPCDVLGLELLSEKWEEFRIAEKRFWFFREV